MIKRYSRGADGEKLLSPNFKVKEFACKDGSDEILIEEELVEKLQKLRELTGKSITITSGYRNPDYNAKIGAAARSKHTLGCAADIQVRGVHPVEVGILAKALGFKGIGIYSYPDGRGWVHVDIRDVPYYWLQLNSSGSYSAIPDMLPVVYLGTRNFSVKLLQRKLKLAADGIFGKMTENAVKLYQSEHGLEPNGIVDTKTWKALFKLGG